MNLPRTLGKRLPDGSTKLLSLFRPNPSTKKIYDVLVRLMRGSTPGRVATAIRAVFSIAPGTAWLCLLAFIVNLVLMWAGARLLVLPLALPLLLALTLFGAAIVAFMVLKFAKKIVSVIVRNKFGLSSLRLGRRKKAGQSKPERQGNCRRGKHPPEETGRVRPAHSWPDRSPGRSLCCLERLEHLLH